MTPDTYTIKEEHLEVGKGHKLYIQDWGNPKAATPIIFLHGGPGAGVKDKYRNYFDPILHRVIFFDQRGSGNSTPKGSLKHNTTADLVEDIEKIAHHLKLKEFILTGGSWGSCLALVYALKYPKRVKAMVLHGILTGTQAEFDWLDKGHFRTFFPEIWDRYLNDTPPAFRDDPSGYHLPRIVGQDAQASQVSAYAYGNLEGSIISLDDRHEAIKREDFDPNLSKLEAHYISNHCFLTENYILDNAPGLKMPIWLVQGRYDMVCPPINAYKLNQKLPNSHLIWVTGGHSGGDRANFDVIRTLLLQLCV